MRKSNIFYNWYNSIDKLSLSMLIILLLFSNVFANIASPVVATRIGANPHIFIIKNIIFSIFGVIIIISFSFFDMEHIMFTSIVGFVVMFLFMVALLFVSSKNKGARRWIYIFGFSLQPSEIIKPFFVILSSYFITYFKEKNYINIISVLILYFSVTILLMLQPDIGMIALLTSIFIVQLFLVNIEFKYFMYIAFIMLVVAIIFYIIFPHFQARITTFYKNIFLNEEKSYQIDKSLTAFHKGGLLGKGVLEGSIKNYIPDAHTDFIFSVIGEEFGGLFCLCIIMFYFYITMKFILKVFENENNFKYISVSCLSLLILFQSVINIGVTLNLIPTKGMTLPLISYGGSSMIGSSITFGYILALTKKEFNVLNVNSKLFFERTL